MGKKKANREVAVNGNISDLLGHAPANDSLQPIAMPGSSSISGMRKSGNGINLRMMSFENRVRAPTTLRQRKNLSWTQIRLSL